jgi:tetratricopeptide (TPR) repeat protein
MGRSRRRFRFGRNGNGHSAELARLIETLSPVYVPVVSERPPALAPVLELEGLDPWTEIRGPALALDEEVEDDGVAVLECHDPAQLRLEPADFSSEPASEAAPEDGPAPVSEVEMSAGDADADEAADASADPIEAESETRDRPAEEPSEEPAGASEGVEPVAAVEPVAVAPPPPPDPAEILYGEARAAADAGRADEAKQLYRQVLATHPAHVRARNNLALLLDAEGNHEAALAELDRAIDVEPESGTLLVNRGALLGAMGRYAAAERDLKKVLRVEPANGEALFNLGVVMTKKGLWTEAIPQLRRAVELDPERGAAHYYLGEALNHTDDLGGALASYQRAAELQPGNPRALYGLGIIYDRLARPDDAARMYRRAREVGRR